MKILLANAYAVSGGASVAARRLGAALRAAGTDVRLLVQQTEGDQDSLLLQTSDRWAPYRPLLDALPVWPYRRRRSPHWGNAWLSNRSARRAIALFGPDVTHLHWINHGLLSLRDIVRLDGPVVWTLHDLWAFTGGCHYPFECRRYEQACGACPGLGSRRIHDISRWVWNRKRKAWWDAAFTLVTPSRWLARQAEASSLLHGMRIDVIPNAVDTTVFAPGGRTVARRALGLPEDRPLFLYAAHRAFEDPNKGADLWNAALPVVQSAIPEAAAVLAGSEPGSAGPRAVPVFELGICPAERMALAMQAADAVVVPSRMENLPNIIAESLSCGTPVAAFRVGGIPEMIADGETGALAPPCDTRALGEGVARLMQRSGDMRDACLAAARATYAPAAVAAAHLALYEELSEHHEQTCS